MQQALKGVFSPKHFILPAVLSALLATGACKHAEKITGTGNKNQQELLAENKMLKEELGKLHQQDSLASALNSNVKFALQGFNSEDLSVLEKNGKVYVVFSDKFLFKTGSALVDQRGRKALKQLADVLNKSQAIEIIVEGHTDNLPISNAQYYDNWELSAARAASVVRIMSQEYKVNPARLSAAGRGEFHPVASNDTQEGRAKNRRIEVILTPINTNDL